MDLDRRAEIKAALSSLNSALEEEHPGESLDPAALRVVLDDHRRLQAIEGRALDTAMDRGAWGDAARYILTWKA